MSVQARQEAVGGAAEKLLDNSGRFEALLATIVNRGANPVFIDGSDAVDASKFQLDPTETLDVTLRTDSDEIWAMSPLGSTVHIIWVT